MEITPISAFSDNYIWLISSSKTGGAGADGVFVVDPGDANPVIDLLKSQNLQLAGILVTHWHPDHIGGVKTLLSTFDVPVFGPDSPNIQEVTHPLADGDQIDVLDQNFTVIEVPGHTLDHIAYFSPEPASSPVLFCGDTLFVGGCGRIFEGTPKQMYDSLQRLASLPPATRVYCAHEYTQANLAFASAVEKDNAELNALIKRVAQCNATKTPTVPSTLEQELATNPFLRYNQKEVIESALHHTPTIKTTGEEVFATLRAWKDNF